jgi:hypothetical protein
VVKVVPVVPRIGGGVKERMAARAQPADELGSAAGIRFGLIALMD